MNEKTYTVIDKCANPYEMDGKKGTSYKVCLRVQTGSNVMWVTPKCTKDAFENTTAGDTGTAYFDEFGRFGGFLDD